MKIILFNTNDNDSVKRLAAYLEYLNEQNKDKNREYIIEIKLNKPVRSVSQNRYYRAILKCIAPYAGYTEDQLHEFYKKKFNGKYVLDEIVGESTSKLHVNEMTIYIKKVKEHGESFFGAVIKDPKDKDYAVWEQVHQGKYDQMFNAI